MLHDLHGLGAKLYASDFSLGGGLLWIAVILASIKLMLKRVAQ